MEEETKNEEKKKAEARNHNIKAEMEEEMKKEKTNLKRKGGKHVRA